MADTLESQLKEMLVETLMLDIDAKDIGNADPLWGEEGLGLDSVDALQIVVSLDKRFGLKISDQDTAQRILVSVARMAEAVREQNSESAG